MKEFKGTKGEWTVCEHSWSDTSILCGGKTVCSISIYDEATEETQEDLEAIASADARLISSAPELLEMVEVFVNSVYTGCTKEELDKMRSNGEAIIKKALGS